MRPACGSSAAIRWPAARTSGYEASDADLFVDRPWVVVPGALAGASDIERVTDLAVRAGPTSSGWTPRPTTVPWPRSAICPLIVAAALVEAVAIRPGDAESSAAPRRVAGRRRSGRRRLARHDPRRPRRSRRWARRSRSRTPPKLGARLRDLRGVLDAWQAELDRPDGPDEKAVRRPDWRRPGRSSRSRRVSDERVFVVPRDAVLDEAGWYGLRTDGLDEFVAALERDGRYEPRDRMEEDPAFKQVIPYLVLRDGERYFLMQRTTAGARRPAPRPLLDRRRRAPQSRRRRAARRPATRVGRGARRRLRAGLPARRPCSTTTRPRSARSTSARSTSPTRRAGRSPSARPTS